MLEQRFGRRIFDDLAEIHDRRPLGHVAHRGEVVGDQQVGDIVPFLDILQQVHHLGANRHVERRDRLVQHDQPGSDGKRAGERNALALAAAELVRILARVLRAQPDLDQQCRYALVDFGARAPFRDPKRLPDNVPDMHSRVERRPRVLEHRLHLGVVVLLVPARQPLPGPAFEKHVAGRRGFEAEHQPGGRRLAAAGLADKAQGFALANGEIDAVDRADPADLARIQDALANGIVLAEAVNLQDRRGAHAASQQLAEWPSPMLTASGYFSRQRGSARGQRSANRQPPGRSESAGG